MSVTRGTTLDRMYVWNTSTLQWEAWTGAVTGGGGGGGAGTEYTEDAAAVGNPAGGALLMVRADTLAGLTSADGDNVAARGTDKGELYVKHVDAIAASLVGDSTVGEGGTATVQAYSVQGIAGGVPQPVALDSPAQTSLDNIVVTTGSVSSAVSAEDSPGNFSGQSGMSVLAVRQDTPANTSDADGDFEFVKMSAGRMWASTKIDTALPTGANSIGQVTANAGTNLNTSALAHEAGGNLETAANSLSTIETNTSGLQNLTAASHSEDVGSADADRGVGMLAVRKATPANTSDADGDYEFLQLSAGRLWTSTKIDTAIPAGANAIGKLAANDGVDIGDVTINNASGAAAVNIQDGGNSITIDATNLDVALSTRLKPADTLTGVTTVGTITNVVHVDDNSGSLTVDGAVTVSGSVTANAGTNLNTSALALEAGGNLASINTKTPALGQAAKSASVPVTIASDQTLIVQYQDGATTSPTTGVVGMGIVNDTPESFNGGEVRPFSFTTEGRLRVSTMPANVDHIWQHTFSNEWFGGDDLPAPTMSVSFF